MTTESAEPWERYVEPADRAYWQSFREVEYLQDGDAEARAAMRAALAAVYPDIRRDVLREELSLGSQWQVEDPRMSYVDVQVDKETYRDAHGDEGY